MLIYNILFYFINYFLLPSSSCLFDSLLFNFVIDTYGRMNKKNVNTTVAIFVVEILNLMLYIYYYCNIIIHY